MFCAGVRSVGPMAEPSIPSGKGIPPGTVEAVLEILRLSPTPLRRRKLLEELERRGRRLSLAGLNRALDLCRRTGRTTETPDGVRSRSP